VASRLFIDAAATPPWQGGESGQTEPFSNSFTRSQPWVSNDPRNASPEGRQIFLPPIQGLTFQPTTSNPLCG